MSVAEAIRFCTQGQANIEGSQGRGGKDVFDFFGAHFWQGKGGWWLRIRFEVQFIILPQKQRGGGGGEVEGEDESEDKDEDEDEG